MAVLSRAGCNQGACHGNQNGKNGFKLSLRGQDPEFDFAVLTRDVFARRVDPLDPTASLILVKATATVPHEGGRRFARESKEYSILQRWIAEGLHLDPPGTPVQTLRVTPAERVLLDPERQVPLRVEARFADGHTRDVTDLAVFEPSNLVSSVDSHGIAQRQGFGEAAILVRYLDQQAVVRLAFVPARPGYHWIDVPEQNFIDRHSFAKLRTMRLLPSPLSEDHVFLRRVYLDALGVLPTADETRRFLSDTRPDKRARLIDSVLNRPEFADFWALKWCDLLRNEEKVLDHKGVRVFHDWIRQCIADGMPLNEFARELLAGRGSSYSEPAANYYRALRDPMLRSEATAQVFLGIRLQCAKCHNHPFERWTQDDYYGLAAFFSRVQYRIVENNRRDKFDKHEFDGEQIVWQDRTSEVVHPRNQSVMPPRFLGDSTSSTPAEVDRLQAFADWVARPDNPFFARAQANRVWYHLIGRGLVEPDDDFRASNPPSHPALLDALAADFAAHRFDLRHLVRTIMNSRTYQLSAVPDATNGDADGEANFARAIVRPLQAEQLLDALAQVTGVRPEFDNQPAVVRSAQLPGVGAQRRRGQRASDAERFLTVFGKPVRSLSCECERGEDSTLNQAFQLITGRLLDSMLQNPSNRLSALLASGKEPAAMVDELYLAALIRPPDSAERTAALELLQRSPSRRAGLEDLLWGLVNAKEFLLRR